MVDIKLYTVADLREWLEHNHVAEGLSEQVIAPTRAWAIIHNPYVKDDDAIVAAIFDDGQLAAYTASFPEMIEGNRIWWASTLYCYPQFTGRGYGMIVVGSLIEAHEPELTYDRWGATETVEIFNHLGFYTVYTPRYYFSDRAINCSTGHGKLANAIQSVQKKLHPWPKPSMENYTLSYASFIDGEAYAFMQSHRGADLWLREQEMLNWIVQYPFVTSCPLADNVVQNCKFGDSSVEYGYRVVKVYSERVLTGCYILCYKFNAISVVAIYCDANYRNVVFASLADHIIAKHPAIFVCEHQELKDFITHRFYFPKFREDRISLSLPAETPLPVAFTMQMCDGDSFAA